MSDITLRLAEACERQEKLARDCAWFLRSAAASNRGKELLAGELASALDQIKQAEEMESNAKHLRALAAALRGATEVSSLDGTRIVNVVITLGDA